MADTNLPTPPVPLSEALSPPRVLRATDTSTQLTDSTTTPATENAIAVTTDGESGFCSADERVSTHTCNSLHPAIAMDSYGNRGVVWHDNRDGDFEIYLKLLPTLLSTKSQALALTSFYDSEQGRIGNFACSGPSGFSGFSGIDLTNKDVALLTGRCTSPDSIDQAIVRLSEGKLDVNQQLSLAYITGGQGTDFFELGVNPGATLLIETGPNANKSVLVISAVSNKTLRVSFDPTLRSDSGFIYSLTANPLFKLQTCELRLTCEKGASLFPDIIADRKCRWHVVYEDNKTGNNEIYYIQIGPPERVLKTCPPNSAGIVKTGGGFASLPSYVPSKTYRYSVNDDTKYFPISGKVGQFLAYGNRNLPTPSDAGTHTLFRDWYSNDGKWIGLSRGQDFAIWQNQIAALSNTPSPIFYDFKTPFTQGGEFGSPYDFSHLVFQMQAPPDLGLDLRTVSLPIYPRCTPQAEVKTLANPTSQDLIEAPKKPLPPTFVDPVDISSLLTSPYVSFSSGLTRFTLDGDQSGTVYTNVLLEDSSGDLSRILFKKEVSGNDIKFILGMSKCGSGNCAVKVSNSSETLGVDKDDRYSLRLQVWEGPDYRIDEKILDSASVTARKLLLDKEFYFDTNENFTTFTFEPNEVMIPRGSIVYFAVIPGKNTDYAVIGKGPGTSLWTANDESGNFNQYNVPFTIPPYEGLTVPLYYDGYLSDIPNESELIADDPDDSDDPENVDINIPDPVVLASLKRPSAVSYVPSYNELMVSQYRTRLAMIDYNGVLQEPFPRILPGMPFRPRFCTVHEAIGGHEAGTTYFLESHGVSKISYDKTMHRNWSPIFWVAGLCIDYSGNWDYDLLVASNFTSDVNNPMPPGATTRIHRVNPITGVSTVIAYIPQSYIVAMVSVPNDPEKYGTYAGKLLLGRSGEKGIVIVDENGASRVARDFNGRVSSMDIILKNANMYVTDNRYGKLYGLPKSVFEKNVGDIIISSPGSNVYILSFKGGFNVKPILKNIKPGDFQQVAFTPYGIKPLCKDQQDCEDINDNVEEPVEQDRPDSEICNDVSRFVFSTPLRLTNSISGSSNHPRLAIQDNGNIWLTYHSDREGASDIYVSRFASVCDIWNSSYTGGEDIRVSYFSTQNRRAMFPKIAVGLNGKVHITFQGLDENGKWQVFYSHSTGGNTNFSSPIQITKSSTGALMPDISVSYEDANEVVTIVWHDDRTGIYQLFSAQKKQGSWRSSYQDGADIRVTNSTSNDMFPRIKTDPSGNLRIVFQSDRSGTQEIYLATYVASARTWSSSGTGKADLKVSTGPKNSLFPDLDTDPQGGVAAIWHDDRHIVENPDLHEEIYGNYCASLSHVSGVHFPPLITNDEVFLDREFGFVDCVGFDSISLTTTPEVCLKIRAPGATFWRAANAREPFSDWQAFRPNQDLDTMIVPWKLTCGNGTKEVCVQVQNQDSVGFPLCKTISLVSPQIDFDVQLYEDEELTVPLPFYQNRPAIKAGDVWLKITSPQPVLLPPVFDVVHQGYRIITNQKTEAISGFSGTAGIGSFIGQNFNGTFSSVSLQQFKGRFTIHKEDGYNYKDGLARVVVKEKTICDNYNDAELSTVGSALCPSERQLPAAPPSVYSGTSGMSGPSGTSGMHGPYSPATVSMYTVITKTTDMSEIIVNPPINEVPYKVAIGAIAQPFLVDANITTNLNIDFYAARRTVPSWLSSFETRRLRVDLIENLLTTPLVIATGYVDAISLPQVNFDPITGLMIDPPNLGDVPITTVQLSGMPTLIAGLVYGISFSDDTYYPLLGTYGANAKYFVVAYGTQIVSGQSAYYYRDY